MQALLYKGELAHCFQLLSQNPNMGRKAPKLGEQVHRHEHGSHVVLYEPDEEGILILAIVHGRSIRKLKI